MRAEAQAKYLDRRCRIARAGLGRRRSVRLSELDDDALRLLGVEKRLAPLWIRVVVADDGVAVGAGAIARLGETRHRERDVVDSGPVLRDEAMQKTIRARGLEHLEVAASLEAPGPEPAFVGRHAESRPPAELAGQDRLGVGQARHRDPDVAEQ